MTRVLTCAVLILAAAAALAQPPAPRVVQLTIEPTRPPVPALKYRLLPELEDQTPGNAAILYHRAMKILSESRQPAGVEEKIDRWREAPLRTFPRASVQTFLAGYRNILHEIKLASRRRHCDWELEYREEGISLLIPEIQGMRSLARLVALQTRLDIADKRFDSAAGWLQTGFAMARHVGDGPTLIQALVGMAIANVMARQVEDFIQSPGAPNLYWSLTALPRPFIDLRPAIEGEKVLFLQRELPRLQELEETVLTPEQARTKLEQSLRLVTEAGGLDDSGWPRDLALTALVAKVYPLAKRFLIQQGRPAERVEAMSTLQVVMVYSMHQFNRLRDEHFKWFYVPYYQARPHLAEAESQLLHAKRTLEEGFPFASLLMPAIQNVYLAAIRTDRQFAALRCVEAICLYAGTHDGRLPPTLDDVTSVPLPVDPLTGRSFEYKLTGDRATLLCPPPAGEPTSAQNTLTYELTLRR